MESSQRQRPGWTAATVVAALEAGCGTLCAGCGTELLGQERVIGWLLGERAERCITCLAPRHGREPADFARHAAQLVLRLDCFRAGWLWAERVAPSTERSWPARWPRGLTLGEGRDRSGAQRVALAESTEGGHGMDEPEHEFDFGDLGCGELVLDLRRRMQALEPGSIVRVLARDPGAPEDLPAWCRLTGHRLLSAEPPAFVLERRQDPS